MSTATVAARSTQEFIDENPVDLVLVRVARVKSSAGGWVDGATTQIDPQRVRLVAQTGSDRLTQDGNLVVPRYTLVGMPDVNVQERDTFTFEDIDYRVGSVSTSPPWAVRASVVENGA